MRNTITIAYITCSNPNEEEAIIDLPKPRRNSIDFSKESEEVDKKFENQVSDFSIRR